MTLSVNIKQQFDGFSLDISFEAPSGITVLFGQSGSGKTSTINAIAGLVEPSSGSISINGAEVFNSNKSISTPSHQRRIGYIFQESRLFPHLTVKENLLYSRRYIKETLEADKLEHIVSLLGIEALLGRFPENLSGGERQRVAIGRALLSDPELLIADEPLAALDDARKSELLPYIESLRNELQIPIIYVTHSAPEVMRLADKVIALDRGKKIAEGSAREVLANPRVSQISARSISSRISATVFVHHDDGLTELDANGSQIWVPYSDLPIGADVCLELFANDVIISTEKPTGLSALNILPATVLEISEPSASNAMLLLKTEAGELSARITHRSLSQLKIEPGTPCYAILKSINIAAETTCNKQH